MTIAWKEKLKFKIQEGEEEESFDEDDLDVTKGLVSNVHYDGINFYGRVK